MGLLTSLIDHFKPRGRCLCRWLHHTPHPPRRRTGTLRGTGAQILPHSPEPERVVQLSLSDPLFSCCLLRYLPMIRTELQSSYWTTGNSPPPVNQSLATAFSVLYFQGVTRPGKFDKSSEVAVTVFPSLILALPFFFFFFWLSLKKCVWDSGCPSRTLGPQRTPRLRSLRARQRPWRAAFRSDTCHRHVCAARRAPAARRGLRSPAGGIVGTIFPWYRRAQN